jgi:hypothetical protein
MNQKSEFEQLQALQQKSHSLRQKREESEEEIFSDSFQHDSGNPDLDMAGVSSPESGDESDEHPGEGTPPEGLISDVGALMTELEEAAAEHPGLALLAAFGIGMVVGQLLSRK